MRHARSVAAACRCGGQEGEALPAEGLRSPAAAARGFATPRRHERQAGLAARGPEARAPRRRLSRRASPSPRVGHGRSQMQISSGSNARTRASTASATSPRCCSPPLGSTILSALHMEERC